MEDKVRCIYSISIFTTPHLGIWLTLLKKSRSTSDINVRVLKRIFGHKREDVTGDKEFFVMTGSIMCTLFFTKYWAIKSKRTDRKWGDEKTYKILVGKPERERVLGTPRFRQEDNSKMDLNITGLKVLTGFN
jgi:hypothetical protein